MSDKPAPIFSGQTVRYTSDYLSECAGKTGFVVAVGRNLPSDTEDTVAEVDFGRGIVRRCALSNLVAA